jgi:parallel beta-helix repeat protein
MRKSLVGQMVLSAILLIFLTGSVSTQNYDLSITEKSEVWVNPENKTYNVIYTITNLGYSTAGGSTTGIYIDDVLNATDPVPVIGPGSDQSYTRTVGPFTMAGDNDTIKVCADYNNAINETNESNNCMENKFEYLGLADLVIVEKKEEWVDLANKTYNITYTIRNIGDADANATSISIYIDGVNMRNDSVPALNATESYSTTIGPFTMSNKSDTIKVCADMNNDVNESDEDNNCLEKTFAYPGGCVADDGTVFTCGDTVTKSCTLDGNMSCPKNGLIMGADNITIDGSGFAIIGNKSTYCTDCGFGNPEDAYCGIINYNSSLQHGYSDIVIKNLEVENFCNGIGIKRACNNTIENCSVHDNGRTTVKNTYGITVVHSIHITIDKCRVYNNTGKLTDDICVSGGHGINFYDHSDYCKVTDSFIDDNYLSGIYSSSTCNHLYIANNTVKDNGYCGKSDDFCAGINLHWEGGYRPTNSTVENNTISNNTGPGIFVAQANTTIKHNTVKGSKNGTRAAGHGIFFFYGKYATIYNNAFCENEGKDISNELGIGNHGDDNTCNTTSNYNDEGTVGCIYYCGGVNGVCIGSTMNFSCGETVTASCTLNRSMSCPAGHGLIIGTNNITIDGNGYTISGSSTDCGACSVDSPENGGCGILNPGYNHVVIKNLQVKDFCTGIVIKNVKNNTIDNCNVRDNGGNSNGLTHGILFLNTDNSTVCNIRIYRNIGYYTNDTDTGGHGIKLYNSDYNRILGNNTIYNNYVSGIFGVQCQHNNITNNTVSDNGISARDLGGGIRLECMNTNNWTVEYNTVSNNTGPGIFVGGNNNTLKYNHVKRNKNGTLENKSTKGHGIFFSSNANNNTIYSNTFGENEGKDIYNDDGPSNIGGENRCDTTHNYDDEGTTGCKYGYDIDLVITKNLEEWVNLEYKLYNVNYTIKNIGDANASASTSSIIIDGTEAATDHVPALASNESYTSVIGPFPMSGHSDTIKVCADKNNDIIESKEENNCLENVFEYGDEGGEIPAPNPNAACVANGTIYRCGDTVMECCTLNGSMECPSGDGLIIGRDGITIDGNEFYIKGINSGATSCGILNKGYDDVTIKNLEIKNFCFGIRLDGNGNHIENNTIEGCNIHHNGNATSNIAHGIKMQYVFNSTIRDNRIHHQIASVDPNPGCEDGGNGLFLYKGDNNLITQNKFYENSKGGIFIKMMPMHNIISRNELWGNGQGGIILRCKLSDFNHIEYNEITDNYGSGIFIGGNNNTVKNNKILNNKDGGPYSECSVGGHGYGINIGRSDGSCNNYLVFNTICGNDYKDIFVVSGVTGNRGDKNTCDSTSNYNDTGATKCTNPCSTILREIDLIPTAITVFPLSLGEQNTVEVRIENRGSNASGAFNVSLFEDGKAVDTKRVDCLAADDNTTVNFTWTPLTPGQYRLVAFADADNEIEETNEVNNIITMNVQLLPDLTPVAINVPEVSIGLPSTITATIKNKGNVDAEKSFDVSLLIDKNPVDTKSLNGLAKGITRDVIFTWTPLAPGNYTLTVFADSNGRINESNETNNIITKEIQIGREEEKPEEPFRPGPGGGGRRHLAEEEEISGVETGPEAGTGEEGAGEGSKQLPINESIAEEKSPKTGTGYPFGRGEMIERVKEVIPIFLIVSVAIIVIALFYVGYYKEKKAHRRNKR